MAAELNPETLGSATADGETIMCLCCLLLTESNSEHCRQVILENVWLQAPVIQKRDIGVCVSRGVGCGVVDRDGFEVFTDELDSEYCLV